jgi:hypothetical protein
MEGKAKTITLHVELTDKIDVVKSKIQSQEGTPADQQRLFLSRANKKEEWTLQHYKIKNGSTIYIDKGKKVFGMQWVDVGTTKPLSLTEITRPDAKSLFCKEMKTQNREGKDWNLLSLEEKDKYQKLSENTKEAKLATLLEHGNAECRRRFIDLSYDKSSVEEEWLSQEDCIKANGRYDDIIT